MNNTKYRVVFMGTPEIGIPSLQKLLDHKNFEVVGVFTNPDKPVGRKQVLTSSLVKIFAKENKIPVYQPEKFDARAEEDLRSLNPDLAVVIAYGKILKQTTLDIPSLGFINIHYSLLPKYRGAVPVQMVIKNGEKTTGITIQKMAYDLDSGDILSQVEHKIGENETTEDLWNRFSKVGAIQLIDTLERFVQGKIVAQKQNDEDATYCYQSDIDKEKAEINWDRSAGEIHNLIRAFNPWPIAWTTFEGKRVKVFSSRIVKKNLNPKDLSGTFLIIKDELFVVCKDSILQILELQIEGKQKTNGEEFIKGLLGRKDLDVKDIKLGK